jgi:hypothetical protein
MAAGLIVQDTVTGPMAATLGQGASVVAPSGDVSMDSAGAFTIGQIVNGAKVADVANANVIGGVPTIFRVNIADASGDTDVVMTHKVRVLDFWFRASGIAGHASLDTVQLKNSANAITDAVAKTATVNSVKRCASIDPTYEEIAAGGTLRITAAKNTNVAGTAYVLAVRVA